MINKILVAVEFSPNNKSVFDSAVYLAKETGANLMLLHVISAQEEDYPMVSTTDYYPVMFDASDYKTYQKKLTEYQQKGLDGLKKLQETAEAAGVDTEYTQLTGNPGRKICELAKTCNADLILIGSRGLTGLKEMFLGSVSNYVTHHAPCSIHLIRTTN